MSSGIGIADLPILIWDAWGVGKDKPGQYWVTRGWEKTGCGKEVESHLVELIVDLSPGLVRGHNVHNLANHRLAEHALLARAQSQVGAHVLGSLLGDDRVDELVDILVYDGVALRLQHPNRPDLLVHCCNGLGA